MSKSQKYILSAVGITGVSLVAWRVLFPWLQYDIKTIRTIRRVAALIEQDLTNKRTIIDKFEEVVSRRPWHSFIIFEDHYYTYGFTDQMANRVANFALSLGLQAGDVVAIMMKNEPCFIWTFLGLLKLGITVAFINYHLKASPLVNIIKTSGAKILILGEGDELLEAIEEIKTELELPPTYVHNKRLNLPDRYHSMNECLDKSSSLPVCKSRRSDVTLLSTVCYIYTSGTTGLPKPAIVNQARAISVSKCFQWFNFSEDEVTFAVTPLYHSASTLQSLFNTIDTGATFAMSRNFSVRRYWDECRRYKVTIMQYIGEMCRYLLRAPKNELDGLHNIRVAFGNGLRSDIWMEFQRRFKIPKIIEFFGATEAPTFFINICDKVGAVGRISPLISYFGSAWGTKACLVKYDPIEETPIRNINGYCINLKPGEEGLLLSTFSQYHTGFYKAGVAADEKKVIRNVFKDGDVYFNFGDLVYLDKDYFIYFRDRVGDTYRWKSENVSTREVSDILNGLEFIHDANVYGVEIPGSDGRAGMAAITLIDNHEVTTDILQRIYDHSKACLPSYARPIFLRFIQKVINTKTHKHRKIELIQDGFDPSKTSDPMYYRDENLKKYIYLNQSEYLRVLSSQL